MVRITILTSRPRDAMKQIKGPTHRLGFADTTSIGTEGRPPQTRMTANSGQNVLVKGTRSQAELGFHTLTTLVFIAGLTATIYFCRSMTGGMPMIGGWTMSMMWMRMPTQSWLGSAGTFMLMWLAMMVAMMLPSSLPMILRYYRARRSANDRAAMVSTTLMMGGYFFVWSVAGAVIYIVGVTFALATAHSTELSQAAPFIIGATVSIAGCMQFMPWTMVGLRRCCGPLLCDIRGGPRGLWSACRTGVSCGASCVACCSGPTLVLLALGMMNPAVIGMTAAVIAMEKLLPRPEPIVRISGIVALVVGTIMIGRLVLQVEFCTRMRC
jgi:predicted metal-binding membrane protein